MAVLQNILRSLRVEKESRIQRQRIELFEQIRCENFLAKKSSFIASALNRSKRSIVLDRAMGLAPDGSDTLITDPRLVKHLANEHYQKIAGSPPSIIHTLQSLPGDWQSVYTPLSSISNPIYGTLLSAVTDDELSSAINSLPNGKAAGLSGIPYEMIKHFPPSAKTYLRDLISLCFETSFIPASWKDATIYPIPKPHDWDCYLKNTRPITLLDTARKLMTKIMYRCLSAILV